eukprot:s297_g25.t1
MCRVLCFAAGRLSRSSGLNGTPFATRTSLSPSVYLFTFYRVEDVRAGRSRGAAGLPCVTTWRERSVRWKEQARLKSELRQLKQEHPEASSASSAFDCFFWVDVGDSELKAWGETLNTFLAERLGTIQKSCPVLPSAMSVHLCARAFHIQFSGFSQEMGRCFVEVAVRSGTFFGSKNPWALPIVHVGGRGEIARYEGDPFRCCNDMEGYVGSCCDLVAGGVSAQLAETFCDAWGILGRTDHMGERCPSGVWPCLFTVDEETETVDELMYFSQPDVSVYVGAIAVLVMILVVGVVVRLMQIFDVRCDCSALMPARQDDDADLYDPDDPASDWGQVVQEAAQEEARKKRQRNCKGWIQERTASVREKWQRVLKCIRRGEKKAPESPGSARGEAKVRRMTSKSSQGRGASQSVVRTSSKLSRGSRGSRGRSPSKGLQGTGRAESKSSRGSRGADSDGRSDAREEDEDEQEELQPAKSETRRVSATISKEVPEVFEEDKRATAACFPPGFVWHGDGADPTLVDNLEKYLKWEATGKELEDVEERDIHPGFHAGNLKGMARLARQQHQSLLLPIVEPMTGRSAKSHSYSADTLYYSCSTLRESRRKKRKRGAIKGPGGKQTARSLETPQKWSWATQDEQKGFRQLPIENGPQFSKIKVPGAQSQHILSLE